jgi:hypothetical protein
MDACGIAASEDEIDIMLLRYLTRVVIRRRTSRSDRTPSQNFLAHSINKW